MIIVTGISGSGKSYTANTLSRKNKLPIISFDIIYGYEKDREKNKIEEEIITLFYEKYPEYIGIEKIVQANRIRELDTVKIENLFFDFVFKYIRDKKIKIIFDGYYFLDSINYDKFKNQRIVIKRTPLITSLNQRTKRCIKRSRGKKHRFIIFLKDIKYTIFHLKEWWYVINDFLSIVEINNNGERNEKK